MRTRGREAGPDGRGLRAMGMHCPLCQEGSDLIPVACSMEHEAWSLQPEARGLGFEKPGGRPYCDSGQTFGGSVSSM